MPEILDVFNSDAFSNVSLTERVNAHAPFVPGLLTQLNFAGEEGMTTLTAAFDEVNGAIRLMSSTARGAPPSQQAHEKARTRILAAAHFKREAHINADELIGSRVVGTVSQQTAQGLLDRRIEGPFGLKTEWAQTKEHMLLGLIDGQVLDGDNVTILYDFFTFFGLTRPAPIVLPFSTATDKTAYIEGAAMDITAQQLDALNGLPVASGYPVALCGYNFFKALMTSQEITSARKTGAFGRSDAADMIGQNLVYKSVVYAGVLWVSYRGSPDSVVAVPTNEARLFMAGVPGLFQIFNAPADTFETVSDIGLPMYLLQRMERQTSSRRTFELQVNPLFMNMRPTSCIRLQYT